MSELEIYHPGLPKRSFAAEAQQTATLARDVYDAAYRAESEGSAARAATLARVDAFLSSIHRHRATMEAARRPATVVEIATILATLMKVCPHPGTGDASIFGEVMQGDVESEQPTVGGLEMACHQLRRKCKFLPSIAEILSELDNAETYLTGAAWRLDNLPDLRVRLAASTIKVAS